MEVKAVDFMLTDVFAEDTNAGIRFGLNIDGQLALGMAKKFFTLPDTPQNRNYMLREFEYYRCRGFWG